MKQYRKVVLSIVMLGLLSGIFTGCGLKKVLIDDHVLDRDGMTDINAPLMEALAGEWVSADGRWSMEINGYDMKLILEGECVYDKGIVFSFKGEDTNVKTELGVYSMNNALLDGSMNVVGTIEQFYTENGALYMEVSHEGKDSESITFEKTAE